MSTNLVSFRGPIGSGKSFAAEVFRKRFGYRRISFADALKLEVFEALWSREFPKVLAPNPAAAQAFANSQPDQYFRPRSLYYIHDDEKLDFINTNKLALRPLLQWWGTEFRRGQDVNYWLNQWSNKVQAAMSRGQQVVVDDARFDNELDRILELGGKHLFVHTKDEQIAERLNARDGAVNLGIAKHASEETVTWYDIRNAHVIRNWGTAESFEYALQGLHASL